VDKSPSRGLESGSGNVAASPSTSGGGHGGVAERVSGWQTWTGVYILPRMPEDVRSRLVAGDEKLSTCSKTRRTIIATLYHDLREKFGWYVSITTILFLCYEDCFVYFEDRFVIHVYCIKNDCNTNFYKLYHLYA
jgi:hypothetical protein